MLLTRDQVRTLDRLAIQEFGIPALVLMENAGRGLAELLLSLGVTGPVLICCGKGNNGGDGLVAARHLVNHGCSVKILLFAQPDELSPESVVHWNIVKRMSIPADVLAGSELGDKRLRQELLQAKWIVDALFGAGLKGALRAPFDWIVEAVNASGKNILAVDIPSGLDADTGVPFPVTDRTAGVAVRASHTATFVAMKAGFANPAAAGWTGRVHVLDIGAPASLVRSIASS
jgi:NAD(P)H-hydrate epimerase